MNNNIDKIVESKYEEYILSLSDDDGDDVFNILSSSFFSHGAFFKGVFFTISIFSLHLFFVAFLSNHGYNFLGFLWLMLGTGILMGLSFLFTKSSYNKALKKKIKKMSIEHKKELIRKNNYQKFMNCRIDDHILDVLKIKYSTEDFKILMLVNDNERPTYSQLVKFENKRESLEKIMYKVDNINVEDLITKEQDKHQTISSTLVTK